MVGDIADLKRFIRNANSAVLTAGEVNSIYKQLMAYKENPPVSDLDHVQEIRQMKTNIENNICPRCGKKLVLRNGKYGSFYGCSGYPNCRFIKKETKED